MEKQVERLVPAPDRLARHLSEEIPTEPLSHQAFSLISTVAAAETLRDFAPNGRDFAAERVDRLADLGVPAEDRGTNRRQRGEEPLE